MTREQEIGQQEKQKRVGSAGGSEILRGLPGAT